MFSTKGVVGQPGPCQPPIRVESESTLSLPCRYRIADPAIEQASPCLRATVREEILEELAGLWPPCSTVVHVNGRAALLEGPSA